MYLRKFIPGTVENIISQRKRILSTYQKKRKISGVIVSMTTYEPRLDIFEYTILSLLRGSLLPEKILIYVPKGFRQLVLNNQESFIKHELNNGLIDMIEMEMDMRCHSKYYYSFQEFGASKDIIICDDDVVYYCDWLKDLTNAAQKHTDYHVLAFKAVSVRCNNDKIAPYDQWIHCSSRFRGDKEALYAEGVGGVYYRKNAFTKNTFDSSLFLKLAPNADDVWLWFWTHYNNLKVKYVTTTYGRKLQYIIPFSQDSALWIENTMNRRNDTYVSNCDEYFRHNFEFEIIKKINTK